MSKKISVVNFNSIVSRITKSDVFIDITSSKIVTDYKIVLNELFKYNKELLKKPRITVLNKVDLVDENTLNKKIKSLVEYEKKIHTISALNMVGLDNVIKDAFKKYFNINQACAFASNFLKIHFKRHEEMSINKS